MEHIQILTSVRPQGLEHDYDFWMSRNQKKVKIIDVQFSTSECDLSTASNMIQYSIMIRYTPY